MATPALTESRHQAEHQQLAEMQARSVLQPLRTVFVADWQSLVGLGNFHPAGFIHLHLSKQLRHTAL